MTEDDRQTYLAIAKSMQSQMEPQFNNKEWQALHDKMMSDIAKDGPGPLSVQLMQIPLKIMDVIDRNNERMDAMRELVALIEQTDAADLTMEAIGSKLKLVGPIQLYDSSK